MVAYFFYGLEPSFAVMAPARISIEKGEGFREIGAKLSQASLVKSIVVFKIYSLLTGSATKFKPGIYELAGTMSVPQIVGILTAGVRNDVTVQIPEGATIKDIDTILSGKGVIARGSLINFDFQNLFPQYQFLAGATSLEGFLFPDTYSFNLNANAADVVRTLLDTFELKAWPFLVDGKNWYDRLILASYVEREVASASDRETVAGILLKRLAIGMPLQVDATLSYAKCNGTLLTCPAVVPTGNDKKIDSPYNTYTFAGLTPTPIANPGRGAIQAALAPLSTPYLYYFSNASGTVFFSKTLQENSQKQAKYL